MPEMIIPGTYITVRAEGLISAGRIATGIVGVVGTAARGPINTPITLAGFSDARAMFGLPDNYERPADGSNPLTLVRSLEQIYNNGAASVVAVRVAKSDNLSTASYVIQNVNGNSVAILRAKTSGSWGNQIQIEIATAEDNCRIVGEEHTEFFNSLNYSPIVRSAENQILLIQGTRSTSLTIIYQEEDSTPELQSGQILVNPADGSLRFFNGEEPGVDSRLIASYVVDRNSCVDVTLTYETTREQFNVPDGNLLVTRINQASTLVTAEANETNGGSLPAPGVNAFFGRGSNTPGNNGADAGTVEYQQGLESIANQLINIVVLAGQDGNEMGSTLLAHLRTTEQTNYERIGVIGASGNTVPEFLNHNLADGRVILVAPGIANPDGTTLPPAYTAAAVAGLISSLPVQTSLTNRPLVIPGVTVNANRGQQGQLLRRNLLTVVPKQGYRVLKGITTAGEGTPFSAITTRRIVDFAKYGVRSAADPYIGRLNNTRVRSALQATLDAFLTRMVEDEALTGYELEVTATRAQEIAGEVSVTMTLLPTFSIDFIRVTINLQ
jgi:hypothetical protein